MFSVQHTIFASHKRNLFLVIKNVNLHNSLTFLTSKSRQRNSHKQQIARLLPLSAANFTQCHKQDKFVWDVL